MHFEFNGLIRASAVAFAALSFGSVALACADPLPTTVNAQLVAPPNVPDPLPRTASHVVVNLTAKETTREIAPGVKYALWTFNDSVPGPLIRVHEGDTVEIALTNDGSSTVTHNIDLHAVNGPGGGAGATTVAPGETRSFSFEAKASGLFTYHCAAGVVSDHIANGMYGGILVEPANGLAKVDRQYYIGESDMYTDLKTGDPGSAKLDLDKLMAEQPTYVVFNGNTKSLVGDNALQAKTGETVRIYFVQGGPNLTSSFHIIGEIFDKAWAWGSLESPPSKGVQTISVPPGGAAIVEFKVDVPGTYTIVDHALGRVLKGGAGQLKVTGDNNDRVFKVTSGIPTTAVDSHTMTNTTPTAASAPGVAVADGATTKLPMTDNAFATKAFSVKAGNTVTFDLANSGKVPHNMRIAPLNGDFAAVTSVVSNPEVILNGKSGTLQWKAPAEPGTYKFRCDIHPAEMTGTISVN